MRHAWLIDPIARTLEAHADPESGTWREVRVHQGNVRVRVAPFDAIELELEALWSPPLVA